MDHSDANSNDNPALTDCSLDELTRAAESGQSNAAFELGIRHAAGIGVTVNQELAFAWIKKAADAGHVDANAEMASRYERGNGVNRMYEWQPLNIKLPLMQAALLRKWHWRGCT